MRKKTTSPKRTHVFVNAFLPNGLAILHRLEEKNGDRQVFGLSR